MTDRRTRQVAAVLLVIGPLCSVLAIWFLATGTSWWNATPGVAIGAYAFLLGRSMLKEPPMDQPPPEAPEKTCDSFGADFRPVADASHRERE